MQKEQKITVGQWCDHWFQTNRSKWNGNTEGGYRNLIYSHNKTLLPLAIQSAIDGRLGVLEGNLARREFTREVELDLLIGIIADNFMVDRDDLKRRRAQSVRNVKSTNGLISLEKQARSHQEQDWDDDEWQD